MQTTALTSSPAARSRTLLDSASAILVAAFLLPTGCSVFSSSTLGSQDWPTRATTPGTLGSALEPDFQTFSAACQIWPRAKNLSAISYLPAELRSEPVVSAHLDAKVLSAGPQSAAQ